MAEDKRTSAFPKSMTLLFVILSGLVSALSLPTAMGDVVFPNLGWLAWVGGVPLYLACRHAIVRQRGFILGLWWGAAYYGLALYWIYIALHYYGEVPVWVSLLGWGLAVLVVAFFLALGVGTPGALLSTENRQRTFWILWPLGWVLQDFLRTTIPFGGFPWASLGYSQRSHLVLLQILDVTGIYGVTFLIALSNAVLGETWLWFRQSRRFPAGPLFILLTIFGVIFGYGYWRFNHVAKESSHLEKIKIAMIQGNIPQDEKWLEENSDMILERHLALSHEADQGGADFIIWPEAAFPAAIPPDWRRVELLQDLQKPLLMGTVTYEGEVPEEWPPRPGTSSFALHNSAMTIVPGGWISGRYDKNHLVPMGEYLPLEKHLFFLMKMVPSMSSFSSGEGLNLLSFSRKGRVLRFGTTICYEDLFPDISRSFVKDGADFLVNLTNDAWYETSSAMYQHFDFSRYRAIEERRAMVRATNTGITGFFGPTGEVIAEAPIFKEQILAAEIPLGGPMSFYARFGDVFAWGCASIFVLLVTGRVVRDKCHGERSAAISRIFGRLLLRLRRIAMTAQ